jgi:general secretion pathway protein A
VYTQFFGLREMPFSITPDPAYLYMSPRHQEALGHLLYGTGQYGGFVQLTGEVGTGKTTIVRTLLEQKLDNVDVAMIHNPRQSELEFVQSICDEMGVRYYPAQSTLKGLVDLLNRHLLDAHARGRRVVLIIDEAQNLDPAVLEQVRLLTNLETAKEKLLRIMLVGQPELQDLLAREDLRQLAQRITARYHLQPLNEAETAEYVRHRLRIAGATRDIFEPPALKMVFTKSGGTPRLINIICDRALLGAYSLERPTVSAAIVLRAAWESTQADRRSGQGRRGSDHPRGGFWVSTEKAWAALALVFVGLFLWQSLREQLPAPVVAAPAPATAAAVAATPAAQRPAPATPVPAGADNAALTQLAAQPLPVVMNALVRLWNSELRLLPDASLCTALRDHALECYRSQGSWPDLAAMNRPAILSLTSAAGTPQHVLLRGLDATHATLLAADGLHRVPLSQLDGLWEGDFLLLWRREIQLDLIGPSSRGNDVIWLRKRLAQATGKPPPPFLSSFYDDALMQSVRRFQQMHGLDTDGLVGIRTLIALDSARADTPTLADPLS